MQPAGANPKTASARWTSAANTELDAAFVSTDDNPALAASPLPGEDSAYYASVELNGAEGQSTLDLIDIIVGADDGGVAEENKANVQVHLHPHEVINQDLSDKSLTNQPQVYGRTFDDNATAKQTANQLLAVAQQLQRGELSDDELVAKIEEFGLVAY